MRLWIFRERAEEKVVHHDMGIRKWRWVLAAHVYGRSAVGIGLEEEFWYEKSIPRKWHSKSSGYYDLTLSTRFALGSSHNYYDGPHCSFSLGFLHFNWSGDWCEKCMPSEKEEEKHEHAE